MTATLTRAPNHHRSSWFDRCSPLFDRTDDPLGFEAGDTNLFRYVGNSPTNATDPSGMEAAANPPATWPLPDTTLNGLGVGSGSALRSAGGIAARSALGGLSNATMAPYWGRVPGVQVMPQIWVYELEKRVRAGTLSHDDAVGIFGTSYRGAQAQGFAPTGSTSSAVHRSVVGFMEKAEAVYWERVLASQAAENDTSDPSWTKARGDFWKCRAATAEDGEFSPENLARMREGKAPLHEEVGVPMELHHKKPQREGGKHTPDNLQEVWPWEHDALDPFRHYRGPRPGGG